METTTNPTPFIKKFKTSKFNYIYDVNSNELIQVDSIIYDIIDEIGYSDKESLVEKFKHTYRPADIREKGEVARPV